MICVDYFCDKCKYESKELKDGWIPVCKAYPDGIPDEKMFCSDVKILADCGNGYKYTPKE